ncbi:MAG: hypothetical protein DRG78_19025, partial [Epsilonproteobacteria bacterium]
LIADYAKLINKARDDFEQKGIELDFNDALFPFVTWIDEGILSANFKEKKQWRKNLLQKKFFNTSNAGFEFYERLVALEKNAFDLRLLYLYCMFLGFRGKYYKDEDKETLNSIFQREKSLVDDSFLEHFPQLAFKGAYAQNPSPKEKKFTSSYKGLWILISISLVVGLVVFLALQAHLNGLLDKYNIF